MNKYIKLYEFFDNHVATSAPLSQFLARCNRRIMTAPFRGNQLFVDMLDEFFEAYIPTMDQLDQVLDGHDVCIKTNLSNDDTRIQLIKFLRPMSYVVEDYGNSITIDLNEYTGHTSSLTLRYEHNTAKTGRFIDEHIYIITDSRDQNVSRDYGLYYDFQKDALYAYPKI